MKAMTAMNAPHARVFCTRHASRGFTYLMLLWWVTLAGVVLMAISENWLMAARREREAELVFRGEQIRQAITAYAHVPLTQQASRWPASLADLLEDRRSGQTVRHLRKLWPDPVTGEDWGLTMTEEGGIQGVYSRSQGRPLRAPAGIQHYSEWRFEAAADADPSVSAASSPASASSR